MWRPCSVLFLLVSALHNAKAVYAILAKGSSVGEEALVVYG